MVLRSKIDRLIQSNETSSNGSIFHHSVSTAPDYQHIANCEQILVLSIYIFEEVCRLEILHIGMFNRFSMREHVFMIKKNKKKKQKKKNEKKQKEDIRWLPVG